MIHVGNNLDTLPTLPERSVQMCVTSPPYFGLRDYGVAGQHGHEETPDEFVATMVAVFREVRRVLRDDGTLWLNLGDSYAGTGGQGPQLGVAMKGRSRQRDTVTTAARVRGPGLKPKDLVGIPWMVAFALRADGWYLRQEIIWAKPNPMPESVTDRCTKAHEHIFLLSKSERYHFDADAIAEPLGAASVARLMQSNLENQNGSDRVPGKTNGNMKAVGRRAAGNRAHKMVDAYEAGDERMRTKVGLVNFAERERAKVEAGDLIGTRNKRSVWTVATQPFREAHFATFPPALIEPCILAGSRPGDTVLDPYMGAGTTAVVCESLGRQWVGCELNPDYAAMATRRIHNTQPGLSLGATA